MFLWKSQLRFLNLFNYLTISLSFLIFFWWFEFNSNLFLKVSFSEISFIHGAIHGVMLHWFLLFRITLTLHSQQDNLNFLLWLRKRQKGCFIVLVVVNNLQPTWIDVWIKWIHEKTKPAQLLCCEHHENFLERGEKLHYNMLLLATVSAQKS